jgi:hypothetical protein
MKPSWKGLKALKLLQKTVRPKTDHRNDDLIFSDGHAINGQPVMYVVSDGKLMIEISNEEYDAGPSYFNVDDKEPGW